MAGHSKWHNIKHRKAKQDAKKSKIYAKVAKVIQMAAKQGDDPSLNPALETALTKAKQAGLPKDVIKKAIDKGAGNLEGEDLEEVFYEGHGPGGVALYIKCVTSNTNRSGATVRSILAKYGASLGKPGSVSRGFQEKGELYISGQIDRQTVKGKEVESVLPFDRDLFELAVLETPAEDYQLEDQVGRVITAREAFVDTLKWFEQHDRNVEQSDLVFLADNELILDEVDEAKLEKLIDELDEDDDVDTVYHNAQ
jgi:YebC/PmpR family DNA-binding regulatory protein